MITNINVREDKATGNYYATCVSDKTGQMVQWGKTADGASINLYKFAVDVMGDEWPEVERVSRYEIHTMGYGVRNLMYLLGLSGWMDNSRRPYTAEKFPNWEHDCPKCQYLATTHIADESRGVVDWYLCGLDDDVGGTILGRFDDRWGGDYWAYPLHGVDWDQDFRGAKLERVRVMGLIYKTIIVLKKHQKE